MSDVVSIALVSAGGPAIVAIIAALTSIFGPGWLERKQHKVASDKASDDLRYERALAFISAVYDNVGYDMGTFEGAVAVKARAAFMATLRPGEGPVEPFTAGMYRMTHSEVSMASDVIFRWLRGEITPRALQSTFEWTSEH